MYIKSEVDNIVYRVAESTKRETLLEQNGENEYICLAIDKSTTNKKY
jgi:hypothetical protein